MLRGPENTELPSIRPTGWRPRRSGCERSPGGISAARVRASIARTVTTRAGEQADRGSPTPWVLVLHERDGLIDDELAAAPIAIAAFYDVAGKGYLTLSAHLRK